MPDRRRRTRPTPTNSLVAAAMVMTSPNANLRRPSIGSGKAFDWQATAWDYYDVIGELRFGINWVSNAMSRVNLAAARPPVNVGDDPVIINIEDDNLSLTQRRAMEIVSMIADGPVGQGQLLAAFGTHLSIAGIGWLVIEPALDDPFGDQFASWNVLATDEIRESATDGRIEVRVSEREWRYLHENAIVVKVWRKHPRRQWQPDAPTRGVLTVLEEIDLLSKHISASAQSRLAGAGVLAIPSEAVFPDGQGPQNSQGVDPDDEDINPPQDTFVETLIDAMTTPLSDRGSAASVVPLVVRVPGELVDKLKHISFATPFDDRVTELLDNAIKRLALGLDIPPEILTGTAGMNHWGAWQVAEEALTLHVEPLSEMVVHALTIGFLRPALIAEGLNPDEAMIWYDTSDLRTRPDRSKAAVEAYDRNELSATAMLRELGLSPDDLPNEEERRERVLLSVVRTIPELAPGILEELGYIDAAVMPVPTEAAPVPALPAPEVETQGAPQQPESMSPALLAACDVIVHRALERAGSRLRSAAGKKQAGGAASVECDDVAKLHTIIDATAHSDLGKLLDGAWTLVPEVAHRYGIDPDNLIDVLDTYTRALLAAGQEHKYGRLSAALGPA